MAYSTPILASIGQKNIRVIEVLLKQKGFNPTRRFQGAAYYELAERRRGPVWQEEVHILKQAYDEYIASSNCRLNQDVQDGLISAVDDANAAADISVQHKARVNSGPCKPVQPVLSTYECEWCRRGFAQGNELKLHQILCSTRPCSSNKNVNHKFQARNPLHRAGGIDMHGPKRKGRVDEDENDDPSSPSTYTQKPGMAPPASRLRGLKLKFTLEDDALLVDLWENKNLTWAQIADFFPGRPQSALQVRYYTRLKQTYTQLPIRTVPRPILNAKFLTPPDYKHNPTSDMRDTGNSQAAVGIQGDLNAQITCFRCSSQHTLLWRCNPEGKPLCNRCWRYQPIYKIPRPLSQYANFTEEHNRDDNSPELTSTSAKLIDDNCLRNLLPFDGKQPMQVSINYEQSDPSEPNAMSELSSPNESMFSSPRRTSDIASAYTTPSRGESETSSSSMNEGSEDDLDEEECVYVRRAEKKRVILRDLMGVVYSSYNLLASSGAMSDGESKPSCGARGSPTTSQSSSDQPNKSCGPKGKRNLSKRDEDSDKEENGEGQQPKRVKSGIEIDGLDRERKFACPYFQRNHHRRLSNINLPRRACYGPGFHTVHRVKEHLYRAHRQPLVCPRCDTQTESEISLEVHMRQDPPCAKRPKQLREGINSTTEKLLRSRNRDFTKKSEAEKWRHVYTILFPADDLNDLPSPYHENHIEANFANDSPIDSTAKRYEEFIKRELFPRIYRVLETKIDEALDSAERGITETLKTQLQGILRDVQVELRDEFEAANEAQNELEDNRPIETTVGMPNPEPAIQDMWSLDSFPGPWSAFEMGERLDAPSSPVPPFPIELEGAGLNLDVINVLAGTSIGGLNQNLDMATSAIPFKVKATYDYMSNHTDDLQFRMGQIITVTCEEDVNWYGGQYVDDCGVVKAGMFPQNVVERYRPPTPPRPTRSPLVNTESGNIAPLLQPNNIFFPLP